VIYLFLFILSFFLTYLIKNHAITNSILAKVNDRSSHTTPTPHGGGIAITISWLTGISYLFFDNNIDSSLYYSLVVGVIISIVSYLDDLFELNAITRLIAQSMVAILGLYFLGGFKEFDFCCISINNQYLNNLFAFILIIWYINLYNFLDGIDGYASSESIFLGVSGFILFSGDHFLVLIVSVLGFLIWNWHKAKIFMGDVGSTLLGYNIAIFTIYYANQESSNFWVWIVLFSPFWFDATLTLLRRYKNGEKLSIAHKKHAYQRLNQSGYSHDKIVKLSIVINIIILLLIIFIQYIYIVFVISSIFLYMIVRYIDIKKGFIDDIDK